MRTRAFYLIAFITLTKGIIMNDEKYEKAKKRVEELKKFYGNLVTYIVINIMLVIISFWFYWVTIFWGIGILLHASKVFVLKGKFLGEAWEEKKIKEIMEQDN
jgi:hypothetical protein